MYERDYGIERQETSGVFQWKPEQKQYIEANRKVFFFLLLGYKQKSINDRIMFHRGSKDCLF